MGQISCIYLSQKFTSTANVNFVKLAVIKCYSECHNGSKNTANFTISEKQPVHSCGVRAKVTEMIYFSMETNSFDSLFLFFVVQALMASELYIISCICVLFFQVLPMMTLYSSVCVCERDCQTAQMSLVTPAWWSWFCCRYTWFIWVLAMYSTVNWLTC